MSEPRFPIQGGLSVTRAAAERAYAKYVSLFGEGQSLDRLGERGGFGLMEFVTLFDQRDPARDARPRDERIAWALHEADVRCER